MKKNGRHRRKTGARVRRSVYRHFVKRIIDVVLSVIGIVFLTIPMFFVSAAVQIDDPGPVLFWQKRVGRKQNGEITYFRLAKFRSMKMCTLHDVPTHQLENPEQYITRIWRFLRKSSLDGSVIIEQTPKSLENQGFQAFSYAPKGAKTENVNKGVNS